MPALPEPPEPPEPAPRGVRAARMLANGLIGDRTADVSDAVRRVVGVQAQDVRAARLQVRARTVGATGAAVDAAAAGERSVVATWAMRGTLHLLAAEDIRWVVGLLGPRFAARTAGRRRQLGLGDEVAEPALDIVRDVLAAGGPMLRADLVAAVAARGVPVDLAGQAPAHLVSYAAMRGLLCRGPLAAGGGGLEPTYVLLDDWIPAQPPVSDADALVRLAERYLAGFGPAAPEDFAAWSGLPLGVARRAFGRLPQDQPLAEQPKPEPRPTGVRLLGHFDTYLLGYRNRELTVPPEFDRRIQSGGGFIMPAVLDDGRAIGIWSQRAAAGRVEVVVTPFAAVPKGALPGLEAEAADLGRFLGVDTTLRVEPA